MQGPESDRGERECRLLSNYLVGQEPPASVIARYREGDALVIADRTPVGAAAWAFVLRHPWALGPLDAISGLVARKSLVRKKLILALALLETSPELSPQFDQPDRSLPAALCLMALLGVSAALKVCAGLLLWPWASPRR